MRTTRLLAGLLLPLGLGLAASAAALPFDRWADEFASDWMRADPTSATVTQYFSGAEQDALDRQLTPITRAYRASRVARAKEGLAALAAYGPQTLAASQRISADMLRWQLEMIVQAEPFQDYTPAEIHAIGRKEVERIEKEMDGYLRQLGHGDGSIRARMEALGDRLQPPAEPDPRPGLLARYEEILRDAEKRSESLFDLDRRRAPRTLTMGCSAPG